MDNILYPIMAPKKVKESAPELEFERAIPADPRDPRASRTAWPCFNRHNPSESGSNGWGAWTHCAVCGLRTEYVPRKGAPMKHQQTLDFTVVTQALAMLQTDLQGVKPHSKLVNAAMDKVSATIVYNNLLGTKAPPKGKLTNATSSQAMPKGYSPPPESLWTKISTPPPEPEEDYSALVSMMTPEEREAVRSRLQHMSAEAQAHLDEMNPNDFEVP